MKLKIKNCAKISYAEFEFNGLTVIAGNNNTGKSTVGKVLYSLFRSLSNADKRIVERRQESIRQCARDTIFGYDILERLKGVDIVDSLLTKDDIETRIFSYLDEYLELGKKAGFSPFGEEEKERLKHDALSHFMKGLDAIINLTNEQFHSNIVQSVFDCVFHEQFRPLRDLSLSSEFVLQIKGMDNIVRFTENGCDVINPTKIFKTVRYIATPDVLSLINKSEIKDAKNKNVFSSLFDKYTLELARELQKDGQALSPARQIEVAELFKSLSDVFNGVVKGEFKRDISMQGEPFSLFEDGFQAATKAENLSMGLKFFVLLRHILQKGILDKRDVLILDEPENHLHPEWQVLYAQILVKLQTVYDLTILVTSHSTFFVNALQQAAIAEGVSAKTKFYLAVEDETTNGGFTFEENDIFATNIFKSFNKGFERIDEIASERD